MKAMDVKQRQIAESTTAQLQDRLAALRERYDPKRDGGCFPGGGYPMAQLAELHRIEDELARRKRAEQMIRVLGRAEEALAALDELGGVEHEVERDAEWVADNHEALFRATDIEPSLKRRGA